MTVAENIGFGLQVKWATRARRAARVDELLGLMGLTGPLGIHSALAGLAARPAHPGSGPRHRTAPAARRLRVRRRAPSPTRAARAQPAANGDGADSTSGVPLDSRRRMAETTATSSILASPR